MPVQLRPIFEIYVDDNRYAVPTLHLSPAADVMEAQLIAQRMLSESEHHLGAEICHGGELLAAFGTFAKTPRSRGSLSGFGDLSGRVRHGGALGEADGSP